MRSSNDDDDDRDGHDDEAPPERSLLVRAATLFHKAEVTYVIVTLAMAMWGVLRVGREMMHFAILWSVICLVAAATALWPRSPRRLVFAAEAVLLVVALGLWVGPQHEWLPFLGRELRSAGDWNQLPLTERRILAWNVISAFALAWLLLPYFIYVVEPREGLTGPALVGHAFVFLIVWGGLAVVFVSVVQGFLF